MVYLEFSLGSTSENSYDPSILTRKVYQSPTDKEILVGTGFADPLLLLSKPEGSRVDRESKHEKRRR